MLYNLDYLIAVLVFVLLVWNHYGSFPNLKDSTSRLFRVFLVLGIADIIFDVITSILIELNNPRLNMISMLLNTIFYLMQVWVPMCLITYAILLRKISISRKKKIIKYHAVFPVFMTIIVLINLKTKWLFDFNVYGEYVHGPYYFGMFAYALLLNIALCITNIVHAKEIEKSKRDVIWEFLIISASCIIVQAFNTNLLMTGFGVGIGLVVLMLTINNPYSQTDNLTKIFDQNSFSILVDEYMEEKKSFHLIVVNVLQLRQINKSFGVATGDSLLLHLVEQFDEKTKGTVFRVSGKRFIILSESIQDYHKNVNALIELLKDDYSIEGYLIHFPAVICGIEDAQSFKTADNLLAYAEYLTSSGTESQKTTFIESNEDTVSGYEYEKEVEVFLNEAIEKDLFEVYYQPVYSIKEQKYITLEALSRLRHPELGFISPDMFITLAEKTGQITEISNLQFRKACKLVDEHRELLDTLLNIKFNLSPVDVMKPGFANSMLSIIQEYNLPPSFFQFEITETTATVYSDILMTSIEEFQKNGIGICLDDFGSGYANLNTVLNLPFNSIKLDRSLLSGIIENKGRQAFYKGIVSILLELGYFIVSEGVETKEELDLLSSWNVTMIQGYYFSKPLKKEDLLKVLGVE